MGELQKTIKRARPIWVARAILFYLLYVNIKHQQKDYGGLGIDSWLYSFAMEVSVSVGLSAIVTILVTSKHRARFFILLFVPVLMLGIEQSVAASTRIFFADKNNQIAGESMSLEAKIANNNFIAAQNALNDLRDRKITSGLQYNNAVRDYNNAKAEWRGVKSSTAKSSSERALEMTTGDDKTIDAAALELATKRAWLLMGFVLLFSAVSGLWTIITSQIDLSSLGANPRSKKPAGSSRPSKNKAVELVDFDADDTALKPAQPSKQAVSGRAESGAGGSRPGGAPPTELPSRAAAKEIAEQIKSGKFVRANGDQALDKLSTRDLVSHSASKKTQAAIMTHLEHMGVVQKQDGRKPAVINDDYRSAPTNPLDDESNRQLFNKGKIATNSRGRVLVANDDQQPDEVELALSKWGGIDKPTARKLARSATGNTTEQRLESALKQHAAA